MGSGLRFWPHLSWQRSFPDTKAHQHEPSAHRPSSAGPLPARVSPRAGATRWLANVPPSRSLRPAAKASHPSLALQPPHVSVGVVKAEEVKTMVELVVKGINN